MRGYEHKYTIWIDRRVALGRFMRRCSQHNIVRWLFGGQTHYERTRELARYRGGVYEAIFSVRVPVRTDGEGNQQL